MSGGRTGVGGSGEWDRGGARASRAQRAARSEQRAAAAVRHARRRSAAPQRTAAAPRPSRRRAVNARASFPCQCARQPRAAAARGPKQGSQDRPGRSSPASTSTPSQRCPASPRWLAVLSAAGRCCLAARGTGELLLRRGLERPAGAPGSRSGMNPSTALRPRSAGEARGSGRARGGAVCRSGAAGRLFGGPGGWQGPKKWARSGGGAGQSERRRRSRRGGGLTASWLKPAERLLSARVAAAAFLERRCSQPPENAASRCWHSARQGAAASHLHEQCSLRCTRGQHV